MRSSEGLQRCKINEMRALKGTDGPCFPAACSVCSGTSGFVCSSVAEKLQQGQGNVPRSWAAKACTSHQLASLRPELRPSIPPPPPHPQATCPCGCLSVLPTLALGGLWAPLLFGFYPTPPAHLSLEDASGILLGHSGTQSLVLCFPAKPHGSAGQGGCPKKRKSDLGQ